MRFVIRLLEGPLPYPPLGPRGRELACYIPPGVEWRQLNYGQGEGQVEVGGCEWGFYQQSRSELAVVLHVGEYPAAAAFEFVRRVAEMVCVDERFEVVLKGTAESCD